MKMEKFIKMENDFFEIMLPESLKKFGEDVLQYSTNKMNEFLAFFKENSYKTKIKGSFFLNHDDFLNRIKELNPKANPPSWAKGCFYGGETQILLDPENIYERLCTLAHETFHLLFQEFIYNKNNMDRIVWLDESLAGNFDGTTEEYIKSGEFLKILKRARDNKKLPIMNDLSFSKGNVKTESYNGYGLFKLVGRYLLETKTQDELLEYVKDKDKVIGDGDTILEKSIEYLSNKYGLE